MQKEQFEEILRKLLNEWPTYHFTIPLIIMAGMIVLYSMSIAYSHHKEFHKLSVSESQKSESLNFSENENIN